MGRARCDGWTDRHRQLRGATAGNQAFLAAEVPVDYNQAGLRCSKPGRTPAPQAAKHPLLQQRLLLFRCRAPPARLPPSVSPPQVHSLPAPGIPANTVRPGLSSIRRAASLARRNGFPTVDTKHVHRGRGPQKTLKASPGPSQVPPNLRELPRKTDGHHLPQNRCLSNGRLDSM